MILYSSLPTTELIKACADSDGAGAWQEFVGRYQRPISLSILRTVRRWSIYSPDVVDDLMQETYLKLCADRSRLLLKFSIEHPEAVDGYIRTTAINVAHDYIKTQWSKKRGSGEVIQFPEHMEPGAQGSSLGGEEAIRRGILMQEIDRCLKQETGGASKERDCLIFWLHYQQGMTANAIAALPAIGITTKGVESAIHRLTRLVRERLIPLIEQETVDSRSPSEGFEGAQSY